MPGMRRMRVGRQKCTSCDAPISEDELYWCEACMPRCDNCGATDHEQGPIDPIEQLCVLCQNDGCEVA